MWVIALHTMFLYSDLPSPCHPSSDWLRLFLRQTFPIATILSSIRDLVYGSCNTVILYVKHLLVQEPEDGQYKLAKTCKTKEVKQSHYRPEQAQRVVRGIALSFLDLSTRRGWVVSTTPWPLYPRERPGTHCTGGWVGPRDGLEVCEKSRPTRIRSPDRPAHSQSLYRLSYPSPAETFEINTSLKTVIVVLDGIYPYITFMIDVFYVVMRL
jgi:hypothetical protein